MLSWLYINRSTCYLDLSNSMGRQSFPWYYGVSLTALELLANLPLSLAIDGYGRISDNARDITEMT